MNSLPLDKLGPADFLETADKVAHQICRDAVWAADACTWLEWTTSDGNQTGDTVFATVGSDLYGGTAGIALFLARYLEVRPSRPVEGVLRGAVQHALAGLATLPASQPGFYDGAAGICFAVMAAGEALADKRLVEHGLSQLGKWSEHELASTALDVIDGRAGLIPLLLDAGIRFDHEALVAIAVRQGDQLLDYADRSDDGWSWDTMPLLVEHNATGFAHGTAGIATALLELHRHTGAERFLHAAREGWRYERTYFRRDQNNWPDFRHPKPGDRGSQRQATQGSVSQGSVSQGSVSQGSVSQGSVSQGADAQGADSQGGEARRADVRCGTAWCHGAVGIGLSRLRAWELGHHDDDLADEIDSALAATRAWFEMHAQRCPEFSLCHGMAGNAELFVSAAQILNRPDYLEVAAHIARRGIQDFARPGQPWPCGGTQVGETPNLMLGLAGIGLFYLRLHAPSRIETPLLVRPASKNA